MPLPSRTFFLVDGIDFYFSTFAPTALLSGVIHSLDNSSGKRYERTCGKGEGSNLGLKPRMKKEEPIRTPDGRYIIVRGRLWRATNPGLGAEFREKWVRELMRARRVQDRGGVQAAKEALGERGPVWWADGEPDQNRRMAKNSTYAEWFATLC